MTEIKANSINQAFTIALSFLLNEGHQVQIEEDSKGKRSGGSTIELLNLMITIKKPSTYIDIPPELSNVTKKFMDGMLLQSTDKPQSRRIINQKQDIIDLLKRRPTTRKACIAVCEADDKKAPYSVCISNVQFIIRDSKLHQSVLYRSHDIWNAFLWNTKGNVMLQHEIGEEIGLEVGTYTEIAVSAHVYEIDKEKVERFIYPKNNNIFRGNKK